MALLTTVFYGLLTLFGLRTSPNSPPTDGIGGMSSCSGLQVRDGSVNCWNDGRQTVCQVMCNGEEQGEFTCTEDDGWSPELPTCARPIEDKDDRDDYDDKDDYDDYSEGKVESRQCANGKCETESSCRGLQVQDGSVTCRNSGRQTLCKVKCDGEEQGRWFICKEGHGWFPELPTCARPIEDRSTIISSINVCPDDSKCSIACQENPRFKTSGSCKGPGKKLCSCDLPSHATERLKETCDEKKCQKECDKKPYHLIGKCVRDGCKCIIYSAQP